MRARDEILAANRAYGESSHRANLPARPARRLAVVTCMDARLEPAKFLGLEDGDAHVIRNAGGVVSDDVLRSLVVSHWLLGTQEALVIAHTDCGLQKVSDEELRRRLTEEAGADASALEFLTFTDLDESVAASMRRIRESPLLPSSFEASGFVYDVSTGLLREVALT